MDDNNTNRDTWMNTPKGRERAKREALNIVGCVKNGVIPDFEIQVEISEEVKAII